MKTLIRASFFTAFFTCLFLVSCKKEGPPTVTWGRDAVVVGWN